jgi:hypothetical protein
MIYDMDTTSAQTVPEYEQHQIDMLLWQAGVHLRNGRKPEAFEIRAWITDFLSPQSERSATVESNSRSTTS